MLQNFSLRHFDDGNDETDLDNVSLDIYADSSE